MQWSPQDPLTRKAAVDPIKRFSLTIQTHLQEQKTRCRVLSTSSGARTKVPCSSLSTITGITSTTSCDANMLGLTVTAHFQHEHGIWPFNWWESHSEFEAPSASCSGEFDPCTLVESSNAITNADVPNGNWRVEGTNIMWPPPGHTGSTFEVSQTHSTSYP